MQQECSAYTGTASINIYKLYLAAAHQVHDDDDGDHDDGDHDAGADDKVQSSRASLLSFDQNTSLKIICCLYFAPQHVQVRHMKGKERHK